MRLLFQKSHDGPISTIYDGRPANSRELNTICLKKAIFAYTISVTFPLLSVLAQVAALSQRIFSRLVIRCKTSVNRIDWSIVFSVGKLVPGHAWQWSPEEIMSHFHESERDYCPLSQEEDIFLRNGWLNMENKYRIPVTKQFAIKKNKKIVFLFFNVFATVFLLSHWL